MTLVLEKNYHAYDALSKQRIRCISTENALHQDIRALRIGILNIMPQAQTYEFNLLKPLGRSIMQIEPVWIRLKTHDYLSTDKKHMDNVYTYFEKANEHKTLDGLIITGAPVEEIPFEKVNYWDELQDILLYARDHVTHTLGICWGGLAIAKIMGIEKIQYEKKLFGVYESKNLNTTHPITGDFDDVFYCPQSRHAGISDETLEKTRDEEKIHLLAHSDDAGYFIFESSDRKYLVHLGHPEYNSSRLVEEFERDKKKRDNMPLPINVDIKNPVNIWRGHRNEFFTQWIRFIYDNTDLSQ